MLILLAARHHLIWKPLVTRDFYHLKKESEDKVFSSGPPTYDFWYKMYLHLNKEVVMKLPLPNNTKALGMRSCGKKSKS
jgi:hypothetical protein